MPRKQLSVQTQTNRKMNNATYALRRQVMDCIYEAKALVKQLPRIDVRITDSDNHDILGLAASNQKTIWIPATTLELKPLEVRHVVFHEICHAAFGTAHDDKCLLMAPVIKRTTRAQQDKAFLKHAA
jgi:hypothetical protein